MRNRPLWNLPLTLLVASALFIGACGDEEDPVDTGLTISCGPGTVLQQGECVVAPFGCDEGQVPSPTGICIDPANFCGANAAYDTATEQCITTFDVRCGAGTVEVDGRCLVEDGVRCGEGTSLFDGICELSDDVCGNGTSLEGVECIPDATACGLFTQFDHALGECVDLAFVECGEETVEIDNHCYPLRTYIDELAASADFNFSTAPASIDLTGETGNQIVFTGAMTGSSNLFHVYKFAANVGQMIRVTIYSRGLPSPGLRIRNIFSLDDYEREVPAGFAAHPSRDVLIPETTEYDLIVSTVYSGSPYAATLGDLSWQYVGVIEVIDTPEPQVWDFTQETLQNSFADGVNNFIRLDLQGEDDLIISPDIVGPDADGALIQFWNSPTEYDSSIEISAGERFVVEPNPSTRYLYIDSERLKGSRTDFVASAQQTSTLYSGLYHEEQFDAEAGQMLLVSHRSASAATLPVSIHLGDDEVYSNANILPENRATFSAGQSRFGFYYIPQDGTYTVRFDNDTTSDLTSFLATSRVIDVATFSADDDNREFTTTVEAENLDRGDWRFVVLHTDNAAVLTGELSVSSPSSPDLTVFNLDGETEFISSSSGNINSFSRVVETAGTYLLALRPWHNTNKIFGGINVELSTSSLTSIDPGTSITETFDASTFDILTGSLSYFDGDAPTLRILNPDGAILLERTNAQNGFEFMELLPGNGTFTIEVANERQSPTFNAELDFDVTTPLASYEASGSGSENITSTETYVSGDREFILLRILGHFDHFIEVNVGQGEALTLSLIDLATGDEFTSRSAQQEVSLTFSPFTPLPPSIYLLEVTADSDLANGFDFTWDYGVSQLLGFTSAPGLHIPDNNATGVTDTITVSGCNTIAEIHVELVITHTYRGDVTVDLTSPSGDVISLHDRTGGASDHIYATYPFPLNHDPTATGLDTGEGLLDLIGQPGNGEWSLNVADRAAILTGTFDAWSIYLVCN